MGEMHDNNLVDMESMLQTHFRTKQPNQGNIVLEILRAIEEMEATTINLGRHRRGHTNDKWLWPERNMIKINCDASWCPITGQGSIGVIARDHEGEIRGGRHRSTTGELIEELAAKTILQR